jgi:2-oxoglutarate ferredoxin oxidoreductase subunit delta
MRFWRVPLDAGEQVIPVGELYIIADRCKECGFCVEFCPNGVLEISAEFNVKGYHPPKVRPTHECNNCGICEVICPEFAIYSKIREKRCFTPGDLIRCEEMTVSGRKREKG